MEDYICDLEDNKLLSVKGTPFTAESKHDYKKTVRKFFKWLHKADFPDGHADTYARLTYWIDNTVPQAEVEALSREQVQKMADCARLRDKVMIWMLFDTGARAEEFLNLRIADVERKDTYYNIRIRHETSKTIGRTIDLSMKESVDLLDSWLKAHPAKHSGEIDPEARIVPVSYSQLRKQLSNLGKRILNRRITPHTMRHSSATYWAGKCVPYQLCYRFGWSMRSDMPTRYIDRAGVAAKQTAQIERTDKVNELSKRNDELEEEMSRLKAEMAKQAEVIDSVRELGTVNIPHLMQQANIMKQSLLSFGEMALEGKVLRTAPTGKEREDILHALDRIKSSKI